jgi:hypothetical protein
MQAARDAAIAERDAFQSELAAALAMRDVALAGREVALTQRDPTQARQGGYCISEYLLSDIPPIPGGWLSSIALSGRFDNGKSRIALQQSVKSSRPTAARR